MTNRRGLADRLEAGESGNALDVLIEIALFEPDEAATSIRANNAGTKVIYTSPEGCQMTHWADDWSMTPERTIAILRARLDDEGKGGEA